MRESDDFTLPVECVEKPVHEASHRFMVAGRAPISLPWAVLPTYLAVPGVLLQPPAPVHTPSAGEVGTDEIHDVQSVHVVQGSIDHAFEVEEEEDIWLWGFGQFDTFHEAVRACLVRIGAYSAIAYTAYVPSLHHITLPAVKAATNPFAYLLLLVALIACQAGEEFIAVDALPP